MTIHPLNAAIAVAISALIAFGLWSLGGPLRYYVFVGGFLSCGLTLLTMIGFEHEYERRGTNVRVLSGVFLALFLSINLVFALIDLSPVVYIILSGLGLLTFVFIVNFVGSTQQ